jgi:hypothetical protein
MKQPNFILVNVPVSTGSGQQHQNNRRQVAHAVGSPFDVHRCPIILPTAQLPHSALHSQRYRNSPVNILHYDYVHQLITVHGLK